MSETKALTTTQSQAVAHAPQATAPTSATVKTIEAILRPAGARDLIPSGPLAGYSKAMVDAVTNSVAKGAPPEELYRFFVQCIRYNLDPLAREVWCINTAGEGKSPQWQVTPSRDGLRRAARRNPTVADIRSGLVRDGDDFSYDGDAGTYVHKVKITAKKGAILGAYCQVVKADGRKHIEFFYLDEVRRDTSVWKQFPDRMVVAAAERTMIRRHVGMSDLYVDDVAYDRLDEMEAALHVMPDPRAEYVDGFVVGTEPAQLTAGTAAPAEPDRANRDDGVKVLNDRIAEICATVKGANKGDALDARTAWLKSEDLPPVSKIEVADIVWRLADDLATDAGAARFAVLVTDARDARWTKEANAKEMAEADASAATVIEPEVLDDDIPDSFETAPILGQEVQDA